MSNIKFLLLLSTLFAIDADMNYNAGQAAHATLAVLFLMILAMGAAICWFWDLTKHHK